MLLSQPSRLENKRRRRRLQVAKRRGQRCRGSRPAEYLDDSYDRRSATGASQMNRAKPRPPLYTTHLISARQSNDRTLSTRHRTLHTETQPKIRRRRQRRLLTVCLYTCIYIICVYIYIYTHMQTQ